MMSFIQAIVENAYGMASAAVVAIAQFILGVASQIESIISAAIQLAISFINGLADGIRNNQQPFKDAIMNLIRAVGDYILSCMNDLISFGGHIIEGLAQGVANAAGQLFNAIADTIGGAVDWAKDLLGIHSPSRVFMEMAKFCILGWTNEFDRDGGLIARSAGESAKNGVQAFSDALSSIPDSIDSSIDFFPTITPVVDLSNVDKSASDIGSIFGSPFGLDLSSTISLSRTAFRMNELMDEELQNGTSAQVINNYDMTQNNYSPKALSQFDIYRQTKNQFSRLKEVVNK